MRERCVSSFIRCRRLSLENMPRWAKRASDAMLPMKAEQNANAICFEVHQVRSLENMPSIASEAFERCNASDGRREGCAWMCVELHQMQKIELEKCMPGIASKASVCCF